MNTPGFEEALRFFREKQNVTPGRWADAYTEAHARAFAIAAAEARSADGMGAHTTDAPETRPRPLKALQKRFEK